MKKLIALFLTISLLISSVSAFADFGGLGDLFGALTQDDPEVKDVMDGLSGLLVGSSSDNKTSEKEQSSFPSLVGPFSGNMVKVKVGNKTYTIHQEFKDAIDKYEEYFDSYIEFMKHADAPDYMQKYFEFMNKYTEAMSALEQLDKMSDKEKGWSEDENAYFTQIQLRINDKLYSALGTL